MGFKQELLNTFNGEQVKDEYEIQHSRHVQAGNFLWFFWGLIILLNISIWIKIFLQQNIAIEALGLLLFLSITFWIELNLRKYRANNTEVDDPQSYAQMIHKLRRGAALFGVLMFVGMTFVGILVYMGLSDDPLSLQHIMLVLAVMIPYSILSSIAIYMYGKKKIDKTYKDK
ncbi:hypothetical protein [Staphylococcus sp. IVB6214]|uniref:hypothetical protein n=1 Tax=Staphylococcus sp. IVB6214 TaxID=2989766 RepID=UPI0021CE78BC|nr:hypothetical protein [Staphylococcus sp. IVB6214]UXR82226.1 hypothetical protein MUA51_09270 [Staphylococcus sp. IVB6214]